ncbi:MAG: hypothetical protein WBF53_03145 [Litorimonas sp.]
MPGVIPMNSPFHNPLQNTAGAVSAYPNTDLSELIPNDVIDANVRAALGKKSSKKALATLKQDLERHALEAFPETDQGFVREQLKADYEQAAERLKRLKTMRNQQAPAALEYEYIPFRELHFMEKLFGGLGLFALLIALCVIPIVSSATLTETAKIGLLADSPLLAGVFGITGLSGILGSAYYRSTLKTDDERVRNDQFVSKAAMVLMVVWITTLALCNYPITFGDTPRVDVIDDGWGVETVSDGAKSGFTLQLPIATLFISTALLELASGAVFHTVAEVRLAQKRIVSAIKNLAVDHLDKDTIPQAEIELDTIGSKIDEHHEQARQPRLMRQKLISLGIGRFQKKLAAARSASDLAIDRALTDTPDHPDVTRH